MVIEKKILEFLHINEKGTYLDVSLVDDDYELIKEAVAYLKSNHLIVVDEKRPRNLEAFGISGNRIRSINAKINNRGRDYLKSLMNPKQTDSSRSRRRNFWRFAF